MIVGLEKSVQYNVVGRHHGSPSLRLKVRAAGPEGQMIFMSHFDQNSVEILSALDSSLVVVHVRRLQTHSHGLVNLRANFPLDVRRLPVLDSEGGIGP